MTRTSKYLNQDTIAALQSFQIEKIDREITDYLDTDFVGRRCASNVSF